MTRHTDQQETAAPDPVAYRRAADYAAAAMIFLRENVLLGVPLQREHLKPRLLGHWGSCPGITLVYEAPNALILERDTDVLLVTGPGHGAPAIHANLWLEGTHAHYDPALGRDASGLRELSRRYCAPDGFPSHLSPAVPGTIHEGGELGYALATAFGAALDAPDRLVACVVGAPRHPRHTRRTAPGQPAACRGRQLARGPRTRTGRAHRRDAADRCRNTLGNRRETPGPVGARKGRARPPTWTKRRGRVSPRPGFAWTHARRASPSAQSVTPGWTWSPSNGSWLAPSGWCGRVDRDGVQR
ncbi:hypothetical protein ACFVYT_35630 [Streptomyces sp. NPDC058290]|uniref:hypothetical protein n=1 Tax=Streptomyces sp. NPDC058290 TaxID=3346426 RepID=UPI0036EC48A0